MAQRPVVRVRPDGVRRRADGARLRVETPVLRDDAPHRVLADRASDDEAPVPRQQKQLGLGPLAQTAARRRAGAARRVEAALGAAERAQVLPVAPRVFWRFRAIDVEQRAAARVVVDQRRVDVDLRRAPPVVMQQTPDRRRDGEQRDPGEQYF